MLGKKEWRNVVAGSCSCDTSEKRKTSELEMSGRKFALFL